MSWMNIIFFAVILNTIVGTSAFIVLRIFIAMAIHFGTMRAVYPMYKVVQVFCIIPGGILCVLFAMGLVADPPLNSYILRFIFYAGYVVWATGAVCMLVCYIQKYRSVVWVRRKNIPFLDKHYMEILEECYPGLKGKRVTLNTNFLLKSPCVLGLFRYDIVLPEADYTEEELRTILMHEATHIVKRDNLVKRIGIAIVVINWFNPVLRKYMWELDEWVETACDITVCRKFFGGSVRKYFQLLYRIYLKGSNLIPSSVIRFNQTDSMRRRIERIKKWNRK